MRRIRSIRDFCVLGELRWRQVFAGVSGRTRVGTYIRDAVYQRGRRRLRRRRHGNRSLRLSYIGPGIRATAKTVCPSLTTPHVRRGSLTPETVCICAYFFFPHLYCSPIFNIIIYYIPLFPLYFPAVVLVRKHIFTPPPFPV